MSFFPQPEAGLTNYRYTIVAERKAKTKKRKAMEGQLQLKKVEMDKAKASSFVSFYFSNLIILKGNDTVKHYV